MRYVTPKEMADKWGISLRRVQYFCSTNRISGAKRVGRQWMLPENALRPDDGRSNEAKVTGVKVPYHFPALVHSRYYSAQEELSPQEQQLLDAQLLHLKGNYSESINLCAELLKTTNSDTLRFGCHFTLVYNSMLLGLRDRVNRCLADMEKLVAAEEEHREDLAFLLAGLRYYFTWDPKEIFAIDAARLSADALEYYQHVLFLVSAMSGEKFRCTLRLYYEALCRTLEVREMTPTLLATHATLSSLYSREEEYELAAAHMKKACSIAVENGLINYLAKYYAFGGAQMCECLDACGSGYKKHMLEQNEKNVRGWKFIARPGGLSLANLDASDGEFLMLLSYGMTYDAIAKVRRVTKFQVEKEVRGYCEKLGVKNKSELVRRTRELLSIREE